MSLLSWGMVLKVNNTAFKFHKEATLKEIINTHDELIGLSIGYVCKYFLDSHFIFKAEK